MCSSKWIQRFEKYFSSFIFRTQDGCSRFFPEVNTASQIRGSPSKSTLIFIRKSRSRYPVRVTGSALRIWMFVKRSLATAGGCFIFIFLQSDEWWEDWKKQKVYRNTSGQEMYAVIVYLPVIRSYPQYVGSIYEPGGHLSFNRYLQESRW
jgi:hypothetical protein